jgi:DNA repair protein RadA/Sms
MLSLHGALAGTLLICFLSLIDSYTWNRCLDRRIGSKEKSIFRWKRLSISAMKKPSLGAKSSSETFFCENCGVEHIKWVGKCSSCNEWNTVKAFRQSPISSSSSSRRLDLRTRLQSAKRSTIGVAIDELDRKPLLATAMSGMVALESIDINVAKSRIKLFSEELNRVLGGGLVAGSVILLAGEPGIGKSTLLIQMAAHIAESRSSHIIYLSGEETAEQIASRADRLGVNMKGIYLTNEVDIDSLLDDLSNSLTSPPSLVIIDSIQTIFTNTCANTIGSISQIRESASRIVQFAKMTDISFLIIGHVTKTGDVAGPRILEHMVDTVLNLEGSEQSDYRLLRTTKNRFGSTSEIGVFTMTSAGMLDIDNPSELFLSSHLIRQRQDGSAVAVVMEGTRPILAEIQSLVGGVIPAQIKSPPRRTIEGYSLQRLLIICAVLEKVLRISLYNRGIFVNIVGGLRIYEPAADLAMAVTIVSSYLNRSIPKNIAFIGEIGLGGELRNCRGIDQRITEAENMGFDEIVVPMKRAMAKMRKATATATGGSNDNDGGYKDKKKMKIQECQSLRHALNIAFDVDSIDELINIKRRPSKALRRQDSSEDDFDDDEAEEPDFNDDVR